MRNAIIPPILIVGSLMLAACQTTGGIVPPGSGLSICADYGSTTNCIGGNYSIPKYKIYSHLGIDFQADAGTEVISATHGTVSRMSFNECAGPSITIKTDIVEKDPKTGLEVPMYAKYFHVEPIDKLKTYQKVKPGDLIGFTIPVRYTQCCGTVVHLHYELRIYDQFKKDVNPHKYWVNGPRKVTCFSKGMTVPPGKAVAPLRCKPFYKPAKTS